MRITKLQLKNMFQRYCKLLSVDIDKGHWSGWSLEHDSIYGYSVIIRNPLIGENHPFGLARLSAREMYQALYYACESIEMYRSKHGVNQ